MEAPQTLTFTINGRSSELLVRGDRRELSLRELLDILEVKPEMVALEVDEQVIDRSRWQDFHVGPANRIEIMKFVGGG